MWKTAVHTHVSGDLQLVTHQKQQKSSKVMTWVAPIVNVYICCLFSDTSGQWTVDILACHVPYIACTFTRLLYANYYANRNRVVSMFSDTSNWILKLPKFVLLRHGVSPVSVCMRRRNSLAPPASTCNHRHPTVPSPNIRCHCTVPRLGDLRLRTASLASLGRPTAADKLPRHVAVLRRRTRQVRAELIGACAVETPQRPGRDLSTPR